MNLDKFKKSFAKWTDKIQNNSYMKTISNAMMSLIAIMMISSIASLINAINIGNFQGFITNVGLKTLLNQVNTMTIDIVSVYVAFLVAYKLGENLKSDALTSGVIGVMSFSNFDTIGYWRRF